MSDTPRTDAVNEGPFPDMSSHIHALFAHGCDLERQNADLLEALKGLRRAMNFRDAAFIGGDEAQQDSAVSMLMRADRDAAAVIAKAEAK